MSRVRKLDPRNLGISIFLRQTTGVRVNLMIGQPTRAMLQEGLKASNDGIVLDDYDRAISVEHVNKGRWRLVHSSSDEDEDRNMRLVYGIFTPDGQLLPDLYACVGLIGRDVIVNEVFQKIIYFLR